MNNEILFSEKQRFTQWWLWLILLVANGILGFGLYKQLVLGQPFGNKPMSSAGLLIMALIILGITLLLANFRLDTRIKRDGIYVRFFPFHLHFNYYPWQTLIKSYVRQYSPIAEYGGWGLRVGILEKGTVLSVSGDKGLQLEFADNKKLLIGTTKPDALTATLLEIGQLKL